MRLRVWHSSRPAELVEFFIGRRFAATAEGGKKLLEDSTIGAGEVRSYRVAIAEPPESIRPEPVNLELLYIYPREEFADLPPGTARSASVARQREVFSTMAPCAGM